MLSSQLCNKKNKNKTRQNLLRYLFNLILVTQVVIFCGLAKASDLHASDIMRNQVLVTGQAQQQTDEEQQTIRQKGIALNDEGKINYSLIWKIIAAFFLLLTLFLFWNGQTRRQNELLQKTQKALQKSEQYNRMLFEESTIGLALCRMNGDLADINPTFASILGRSVEETLKLTYWDITPEKYAAEEQVQLASLEKTGRYGPYEKEYIHTDGHLVPVRLSGQILEKGGEKFIWSSIEDITEYKQAEAALQESEERLRLLVESADLHLWSIDMDLKFTQSLGGGLKDLGLRPNEIVGLTLYQFFQTESPEFPPTKAHVQALGGKQINYEAEWQGRYFQCQVVPQYDASEKIVGCIGVAIDITERKQVEEALRRSEVLEELASGASLNEILTALVINAEKHDPEMLCSVMLLAEDGSHLRYAAAPSLPDFFVEAMNGLEIDHAVTSCGEAVFTGKRVIVEDIMSHPNWVGYRKLAKKADLGACWSEPVVSSTGEVLGTFAIYYRESRAPQQPDLDFIQDSAHLAAIAVERIQAEEELRKSEDLLKRTQAVGHVGSWVWNLNKGGMFWSDESYRILGYSPNKVDPSYELFFNRTHPDDRDLVSNAVEKALHEKVPYNFDFRIITEGGLERVVNGQGDVASDASGRPVQLLGTIQDITERKQAEEALREERDKAQCYLDTVEAMIIALDLNGHITLVNRKGCELLGYEEQELIGKNWFETCLPQPEGKEIVEPAFLDIIIGNLGAAEYYENLVVTRHGEERLIAWHVSYLRNVDGKIIGSLKAGDDITERKQAEENTLDLLQQNRDLTQRMFQIQEEERHHLAREIHDELGQWLTAMQLNAHIMIEGCVKCDDETYESVKIINKSAKHMHASIRNILHSLRPTILDELGLTESLRELVDLWQDQHIHVGCELVMDDGLNNLDETMNITIYRIVQEALNNVAKHAEASLTTVNIFIEQYKDLPVGLNMSIEDNGNGMDLDEPTNGLGIAGMRERVLAAGGEFNNLSSPGKGMRIEVSLPVTQQENV